MNRQSFVTLAVFAAMIVAALFVALPALADGVPYKLPVKRTDTVSAVALGEFFAGKDYTLDRARKFGSVPRIFVRHLPAGIDTLPVADKESVFIRLVLPLVAKGNQLILQQRERLIGIKRQVAEGWLIGQNDRNWLGHMARVYNTRADDLDMLLRRADVIPASLAVAQAITESGWGNAVSARRNNGLFGTHAPNVITASSADVTAFPSLMRGVLAYMYNLNAAPAYEDMRRIRAEQRADGVAPSGVAMAAGFAKHPSGGAEYVTTLHDVMRARSLAALDSTVLAPEGDTLLVAVTR